MCSQSSKINLLIVKHIASIIIDIFSCKYKFFVFCFQEYFYIIIFVKSSKL